MKIHKIYNAGDKILLDNSVYTHMYTKLFYNSLKLAPFHHSDLLLDATKIKQDE